MLDRRKELNCMQSAKPLLRVGMAGFQEKINLKRIQKDTVLPVA